MGIDEGVKGRKDEGIYTPSRDSIALDLAVNTDTS
jgi:hypothetical protein